MLELLYFFDWLAKKNLIQLYSTYKEYKGGLKLSSELQTGYVVIMWLWRGYNFFSIFPDLISYLWSLVC